jgi:hypothetical protein
MHRFIHTTGLSLALGVVLLLTGCSGKEDTPVSPAQSRTLRITPASRTIWTGGTATFTASVDGSSGDAIRWSIAPALGAITQSGVYAAPESITGDSVVVIVTAALTSDPQVTASAVVTLRKLDRAFHAPGVGTTYTQQYYSTDINGQKKAGSDQTYACSVVAVGQTFSGKDSLIAIANRGTTYYRVENNGDLTYVVTLSDPTTANWGVLPFGSRAPVSITFEQSTKPDGSHYSYTYMATFDKTETAMIGDTTVFVEQASVTTIEDHDGANGYHLVHHWTYRFAPAIGWFARVDDSSVFTDSNIGGGSVSVTSAYSLK